MTSDAYDSTDGELAALGQISTEFANMLAGEKSAIGKYAIVETVSVHRHTIVFKARDPDLERFVALKLYHSSLSDEKMQRAMIEGRALAKVDCPFVARCHSVEALGNAPVLVNEWIVGQPLDEYLKNYPLDFDQIRIIFRKILLGIQAIHDEGLLHRDIKPSNIVVSENGDPKIIVLGLVQNVDACDVQLAGTCAYMAPAFVRPL